MVGKGGSGKSVIAGTIARVLAKRGERVLALDSDPIPGMAISLGLGPLTDAMLIEASEKNEEGRWKLKKGVGAARAVQRYSVIGPDGVRLLQFGKAGLDGLNPVMGSVNAFYAVVHRLARTGVLRDWSVVGDLPAGPRQAAFDWAPYADTFLVVAEPGWQSILTARRVARIAGSRPDVRVLILANKVREPGDAELIADRIGKPVFASVPADPAVASADRAGVALIDHAPTSDAVIAIESLVDRLDGRTVQAVNAR